MSAKSRQLYFLSCMDTTHSIAGKKNNPPVKSKQEIQIQYLQTEAFFIHTCFTVWVECSFPTAWGVGETVKGLVVMGKTIGIVILMKRIQNQLKHAESHKT